MRRLAQVLSGVVLLFGLVAVISLGSAMARSSRESAEAKPAVDQAAGGSSRAKGGHVDFIAEGQNIAAEKPAAIVLHFRVDPGFHINSHTPKSDMLIPTKLLVEDMTGAEVSLVDFPAGTPYSFAFEPKTKLDVYTGDVILTTHVKARAGNYTMKAALHYQACDQAACYPPKTLSLEQPFSAR